MTDTSRRHLIAGAGVGAVAGTVALAGGVASADAAPARPTALGKGSAKEAVVAIVEDHHGDTVQLLLGERSVVLRDRDLVVRILNAAGGK